MLVLARVRGRPDREAEQVAGAERGQQFQAAAVVPGQRDRGRSLEPMGQGVGAGAVGRASIEKRSGLSTEELRLVSV